VLTTFLKCSIKIACFSRAQRFLRRNKWILANEKGKKKGTLRFTERLAESCARSESTRSSFHYRALTCHALFSPAPGQQEYQEKKTTSACDRLLCRTRHCFPRYVAFDGARSAFSTQKCRPRVVCRNRANEPHMRQPLQPAPPRSAPHPE
jgi:hypothetical protein